uniref:Uncharacterized protein n=1 Tax=Oncorhynchus kisutch TaxID=8019 RepID=A0A8C7DJ01_ONCKI
QGDTPKARDAFYSTVRERSTRTYKRDGGKIGADSCNSRSSFQSGIDENATCASKNRADGNSGDEVTIAIKTESPEIHQPLTRKVSKVKISEGASAHKRKTTTEPSKVSKKARSLANGSSTGSLRSATSTSTKITKTRIAKISDQSPLTGTKHRSVLRSASDDHLYCSLSGLSPHVMISTSHGETLCLSDDTVEDVDIGLLDDMAVLQMQKLMKLMDYLFNKVKVTQPMN